jgi:hypothetical protein
VTDWSGADSPRQYHQTDFHCTEPLLVIIRFLIRCPFLPTRRAKRSGISNIIERENRSLNLRDHTQHSGRIATQAQVVCSGKTLAYACLLSPGRASRRSKASNLGDERQFELKAHLLSDRTIAVSPRLNEPGYD